MKAKCQVKAIQVLRNNRIQLQANLVVNALVTGHVQIQLPTELAKRLLDGEIELERKFMVELSAASPHDQPFTPRPNGLMCSVCGSKQFTTPGGPSCKYGHGGAVGFECTCHAHCSPDEMRGLCGHVVQCPLFPTNSFSAKGVI